MNHKNNQNHLTADELIAYMVDKSDLSTHRIAHLSNCELCLKEKETLERQLTGLRQQAEASIPSLSKKLRLPADKPKTSIGRRYWIPAFGSGIALVLVIMVSWWSGALNLPFKTDRAEMHVAQSDDDLLMQISALIDNPLPETFSEIAVVSDFDLNDEVTDFIVPSIENDQEANLMIKYSGVRT